MKSENVLTTLVHIYICAFFRATLGPMKSPEFAIEPGSLNDQICVQSMPYWKISKPTNRRRLTMIIKQFCGTEIG